MSAAVKQGYKQTEVGVIPEDWNQHSLSTITTQIIDGTHHTPKYTDSGVPFLRVTDIQNSSIDFDDLKFISQDEHQILKRRCNPEKGDLLLSKNGTIGIPKIVSWDWEFSVFVSLALLKLKAKRVSPQFLYQFLKSDYLDEQIRRRSKQGTVTNLHLEEIREFLIPLPPTKAEQEAIAEALSDADAFIESLEQLIAKKRQIKQGAMQELLTGKKRLPGFSGEWEVRRLGDYGTTYGGLTGKGKSDFGEGTSSYITFMNIMSNVVIDCKTFEKVRVQAGESQNRVMKGDLFFNGSSETPEEVGMCSVLTQDVQNVYLNSFCFGFRFQDGVEANGLYLAYYFRSSQGRELLKSLAQGATRYNLSKTALLRVSFSMPSLTEQSAIVSVLSDMDAEIDALELKLEKARWLKQGMMHNLLTGKIRLV